MSIAEILPAESFNTFEQPLKVQVPKDASVEVAQAITEHNSEVAEIVKTAGEEVVNDTHELFDTIEKSLLSAYTGAQDSIKAAQETVKTVLGRYPEGANPDEFDEADRQALLASARIVNDANTVINAVKEVQAQTGLLFYAETSRITASIAATPTLIVKEYKKLQHFLRKHRITEFKFDNIFGLSEKYNNVQAIRNCNVTLYCFLRYLNDLNAKGKLVENFIYAKFTAAIISAGFVAGQQLNLTSELLKVIPAK
jgi:hypothetical protein